MSMKFDHLIKRVVFLSGLIAFSGCQTVKMPKIDVIKSPEFSEDAANIPTSYPRVIDAPIRPEDIRSDRQWDRDAKALQALRAKSVKTDSEPTLSQAEIESEFEALKAKVQAYKKDDPAGGVDSSFHKVDLKPRQR